jgi:nitroreductase
LEEDVNDRDHHLDTVDRFFNGPLDIDRLSFMSDDCEWFNGLGKFPAAPGVTVFRGKDEIGRVILGRAPSPPPPSGRKIDRYDLTTRRFDDIEIIADGAYVFRQHRYTVTTVGGRPYSNVYGFLFRFNDDGLFERVWEHWGTLTAYEQLFQYDLVVKDPDVLLMSTPSVRLRLDLERPVDRAMIEQCLDIAVHAPNGSNSQPYRFLCIDDPDRKAAIADLYRVAMDEHVSRTRTHAPEDNVDRSTEQQKRIAKSVIHLRDHLHEVPVLCVPIVGGRTDGRGAETPADRTSVFWQSSRWGSVVPTLWSFMLALRSRGLGSAWTTLTLHKEREMAELLGIPYDQWMQVGLFPIAYTLGNDFAVTPREPAASFLRWNDYRL